MERKKISIYTNLEEKCDNYKIMAIIHNDVIKYIDLANNIMIIDMQNDVIIRENTEYKFNIDLNNNYILIYVKKLKKEFKKDIKTILLEKKKKEYLVRYQLFDENIINEYYVKF